MTYEEYKDKKKEKRREDMSQPKRSHTSKKYQTVK